MSLETDSARRLQRQWLVRNREARAANVSKTESDEARGRSYET